MSEISYCLDYEVVGIKPYLTVRLSDKPVDHKQLLASSGKEIANFLWKEQLHFQGVPQASQMAAKTSLQKVHVRKESARDAILLLGPTRKVYWRGKKLIVDPFTRYQWTYEAEEKNGIVEVTGHLVFLGKTVLVKEDDFFFPSHPGFVIEGGVFRNLDEECDAEWIGKMFGKSIQLEGKQKQRFLEECSPIHWKSIPISSTEIFPFLVLKDRTGGFADLWLDYGNGRHIAYHDPSQPSWRDKAKEKFWEKDLLETDFLSKMVAAHTTIALLIRLQKALAFCLKLAGRSRTTKTKAYCFKRTQSWTLP